VGGIGVHFLTHAEVGVATESGRSYYAIISILKRAHIPFIDILFNDHSIGSISISTRRSAFISDESLKKLRVVITTRRERLQIPGPDVICIEDLGDDLDLAKQKLLAILHPVKDSDKFVVGIDPGQRTGIVAFMNHVEVNSAVVVSIEDAISQVRRLLDNAPKVSRIVKIGAGMPVLAEKIALSLDSFYGEKERVRIQLVDERGTSSLYARGKTLRGTRDQRSAKLIAFREGRDYVRKAAA
jgi:hypothetical protein